jgi:hypothetical protein
VAGLGPILARHNGKPAMQTLTTPKASPALLARIDRLTGCQGHWVLIRDGEPETDCSHQWHQDPAEHLQTCLADRWRGVSLGFVPSYCGYSDYSNTGLVGLSNYRVLTDPSSTLDPLGGILEVGYGWNGRGVVLDLLRVPADVIEAVESLEAYPLLSEDDHSQLEWDGISKLWDESVADRVRTLQDLGLCIFAARRDSTPWECDRLRESLTETLNEYPTLAA